MKKRVLLISTAQNYTKGHGGKNTPCAALGAIAAYTPSNYDLILVNEQNNESVYHDNIDLVGFSAMTCQIKRAIEISKYYRALNIPTVIGGIHATVRPEDTYGHFDATVVGEGDSVWGNVLADFEKGELKKIYKADGLIDMAKVLPFRHDLLYKKKTALSHAIVQATRGCPYKCEFCSVTDIFGSHYRTRPVENVAAEVKSLKQKLIFFIDDNIMGNHKYAYSLFEKLIPLKKAWVGQASLELSVKDLNLLKLARKSGCQGLFIGIESVTKVNTPGKLGTPSLKEISKKIKILRDHGLIVNTSVIYGFDHDDQYCFEKTVEFLIKNRVAIANFPSLTPYPGSALFTRLENEGRILHYDWEKYNNHHPTFKLKGLTPEQLVAGGYWSTYHFYNARNILKRLPANLRNFFKYAYMNFQYNRISSARKNEARITKMPPAMRSEWLKQI
ncbi:MAG: B12-binding domain-containing radical SAM protein [Deltaproteobacteria bacterium]|nr:B12-binding domain-containing radical SAM protein [Deltaproteobacteria bacterium]